MVTEFYKNLLSSAVQEFILSHEHDDGRQLVLKHKEIYGVPAHLVAEQIAGRRKAKDKLPTYFKNSGILYPAGVNLEQSSSEQTASYKLSIFGQNSIKPGVVVDLTGGFGIDALFFSRVFGEVHTVEPFEDLQVIARHNHQQLGAQNIVYHATMAEDFLASTTATFDLAYIDPSRRAGSQKVFKLSDCAPDVVGLQDKIFEKAPFLLIKASPLLDIQQGLKELHSVRAVYVVAVGNECKELLFLCVRGFVGAATIVAVNIKAGVAQEPFTFTLQEEQQAHVIFAPPGNYLYEPSAAVLKGGAFKTLAVRYPISKIEANTHLYTSNELFADFPGRVFKVEAFVKSDPKSVKPFFAEGKANVVTRNYPLAAEVLKKKVGLQDGGDKYLLAFSGSREKFLAVAHRIQ